MALSPIYFMRRFSALLLIVLILAGCSNKEQSDELTTGIGSTVPTLGVPMPTTEILAALGPENDIPIHRLLPESILAIVGKPKQFLDSPVSAGGEMLVANTIAQGLRLYAIDPDSVERSVQSTGIPMPVLVNIPNPQNPGAMPQSTVIPIARRATVITFNTAVDVSLLVASILDFNPEPALLASLKRTEGRTEYYDLTPPNIGIPQRVALGLIDERTAVIVEGVEDDIKAVFSNAVPQNAVLERLKHTPVDSNDLTILTSLEGLDISPEMLESLLAPLDTTGFVPPGFVQTIKQHLRALTVSLNVSAAVGQPIVSVYAEGRDAGGAEAIGGVLRGMIVDGQVTLATMSENAKQQMPIPSDFALALLNAITVEVNGTRVHAVLSNFETLIPTVNAGIRSRQTEVQQAILEQRRRDQLWMLVELSMAYYQQHGKFPADLLDAEGKPLLSWRVALLPQMGLQDFYNEFKLDEPWDSEANLKLLESMPIIFHPFVLEVDLPKTVVRFFDSPGTPFSNRDLKLEDLTSPQTTLMFVIVSPEYAVEWTKPDSLEFNLDNIGDIVGDQFFGVTFMRQILLTPVQPASSPQYENWKRDIEALVRGTPLESPEAETTP